MDKHLNLFYTYKTSHLEDNVTRALIATLKNLEPIHLRLFLKELIIQKLNASQLAKKGEFNLLKPPDFTFDLQITEPLGEEKLEKWNGIIVGITYSGTQNLILEGDATVNGGSRPDGLVMDKENEICAVFEAKLSDTLYREQIQRHYQAFFDTEKTALEDIFVEISWTEIAEFLREIARQSQNSKEIYMINQFNEYLDLLELVEFLRFHKADFSDMRYEKLHKFLAFVTKETAADLSLEEYKYNRMLYFEDIPSENLWIEFGQDALDCGIVLGSGKKRRSQQFLQFLTKNRDVFNEILAELRLNLPSKLDLNLKIHSHFHLSRFRIGWLGNIRGIYRYPEDYDRFYKTFSDQSINTYEWIDKAKINQIFKKEIEENASPFDSKGLFPAWDDADIYLQYCYIHIDVSIPEKILIYSSRADLVTFFKDLFVQLKDTMSKLHNVLSS